MANEFNDGAPLVSVVMPAYKSLYLTEALESISCQTYRPIELIVCDDARNDEVEQVVEAFRAQADFSIRYQRNETRLWEMRSTARGVSLAQGRYVKFLHDDDVLHPACIASLVAAMEADPGVSLASSRRRRVDEQGNPLPDILATVYPFAGDVLIDGGDLISFLAEHAINFIGEPSTVLCRRDDLLDFTEGLSVLNGTRITWVADLALYVKLLRRGNLAMLAEPLTDFRVSREQFSQKGRDQPGIGEQAHTNFRQAIRDLGWYREGQGQGQAVRVAPITQLKARVFKPVKLLEALYRTAGYGSVSLSTWLQARRPSEVQQRLIDQRLVQYAGGPKIAVLLVDEQGDEQALERSLDSLELVNLYGNLETLALLPAAQAGQVGRCRRVALSDEGLAATINAVLSELQADWLLLVEVGTAFTPSGLLVTALELLEAPAACLAVYADEVVRLGDDEYGLALRPDLNLDMLLSFPAGLSRHWLFRREALAARSGFVGQAFELEYQLRLVHELGFGCIGHVAEPLLVAEAGYMRDDAAERLVIEQHLHARGYTQAQVRTRLAGRYELDYAHAEQASVSILIEVKGSLAAAQRCVEGVLENTTHPHYEVLLLQGSDDPATLDWLAAIEQMGVEQVRVIRGSRAMSRVAWRNQAAVQARGDFLLWLDDSAGVLAADWLQQLLNHAQRPEVGAVSGKLLAADGKVRHGGLILGLCGPLGRVFEGLSHDDAGYMQRLQIDQDHSVLAGECLMLRRALFIEAGGFDESPALARWGEADLCLRLQQAGYLNVWTPRVPLLVEAPAELEQASVAEEDALYARWLPRLARDPAYNPGFSLVQPGGFKLADPALAWRPLSSWKPVPTVLAHPADQFGCGHYRVMQPFTALQQEGLIDGALSMGLMHVTDLERYEPDAIVLQRQIGDQRIEAMRRMQAFSRAFKVYELDDYLPNLPMKNAHRENMPKDILKSLRQGLGYVDRFVVSTTPLAEALSGLHTDIRVVENRLPVSWWQGLNGLRRVSAKPRVGWAGGSSHTGDLEMIADVVKELANEVEWVFFGMCPDRLRPYVHEFHTGVAITQYPAMLASLNLDLALAPVEQNLFNECKSNLRILEYGACGFPVICSDIRCYQGDGLPVTRVKNRFKDWIDAIRMHLSDLDATGRLGDELQAQVRRDWMLDGDNLESWRRAWLPD